MSDRDTKWEQGWRDAADVMEAQRTVQTKTDDGDHDKFSHYVIPPAAITRASVTGTPVTALCGKTWVPSRAPEGFPVCPTCAEIKAEVDAIWSKRDHPSSG